MDSTSTANNASNADKATVHVEGDVSVSDSTRKSTAADALKSDSLNFGQTNEAPETTAENRQTAEQAAKTLGDTTRSGREIDTAGTEQAGGDELGTVAGGVNQPHTSAEEAAAAKKFEGGPAGETEEQRGMRMRMDAANIKEGDPVDPLSEEGLKAADEANQQRQAEIEARQAGGPAITSQGAPGSVTQPADIPEGVQPMESDEAYSKRLKPLLRRRLTADLIDKSGEELDQIGSMLGAERLPANGTEQNDDTNRHRRGDEISEVMMALDGIAELLDKIEMRLKNFA